MQDLTRTAVVSRGVFSIVAHYLEDHYFTYALLNDVKLQLIFINKNIQ